MRLAKIDILRAIGILMIIFAHIGCGGLLHELRSFDVPLMVFVSALTVKSKAPNEWGGYFYKRTKRLLLPVYFFLVIYFLLSTAFGCNYSWKQILLSFGLFNYGSIGYVWIIKVFLMIMIVSPILNNLKNIKLLWFIILFFVFLVVCYLLNLYLCNIQGGNLFSKEILIPLIGYSAVYVVGLRFCDDQNLRDRYVVAFILFLTAVITLRPDDFECLSMSHYLKHPPTYKYIIYGSCISTTLWLLLSKIEKQYNLNKLKPLIFIGQNSIWIYLWHIVFLQIYMPVAPCWYYLYCLVTVSSLTMVYFQYTVIKSKRLNEKYKWGKYLLG